MLRFLPPALLVAVALHQLWLAHTAHLTPWCGGGFGMFSTTDGRFSRHLHAVALSPGARTPLEIPDDLAEDARAVAALPEEERLRALALALAPFAPTDFEAPQSIRIEVFATRWDARTLAPSGEVLRAVEAPLAEP